MLKALFAGRRLLVTLIVLAGAAGLCRLGIWQLDRLAQRQAINTTIDTRMAQPPAPLAGPAVDPAALEYRRVEVRGVYDPAQEILLRNRALDGVPGVHVITPLRLSDGAAVLVDRGWLPIDQSRPEARSAFAPPPGEVVVDGVARRSQEGAGGPADPPLAGDERRDAWFRVATTQIQAQTGYPLLPIYLEQQPAPGDPELPRRIATSDLGAGPHLGYAIQWFAFAVILLVGYVAFTYQRLRRGARDNGNGSEHTYSLP
jgi:surfeit locus 1 family protein